jgi:hypothetical protein
LDAQNCGPKPEGPQCQIYDVKAILGWMKNLNPEGGDVVSTAQSLAVELVRKRAQDLARQDWLEDPWGLSPEILARRQRAESRR